jgi:hypothetical protein
MKLSDERLDHLLDASAPIHIHDERLVRETVAQAVMTFEIKRRSPKRTIVVGAVIGGLVLAGTTAAALPSFLDGFGRVDYQSVQEYTLDGRGPFRCEFAFRVDPPMDGVALEPSSGTPSASYAEIQSFVQTHDWAFDDEALVVTTPPEQAGRRNLEVLTNFISDAWTSELALTYPDWMEVVGGFAGTGGCVSVVDGSAP